MRYTEALFKNMREGFEYLESDEFKEFVEKTVLAITLVVCLIAFSPIIIPFCLAVALLNVIRKYIKKVKTQ